jgi:hypothetical protein
VTARNFEYGEAKRRGRVFTLRLEPEEEKLFKERMATGMFFLHGYGRRRSLGAFIIKAALKGSEPAAAPSSAAVGRKLLASGVKAQIAKALRKPRAKKKVRW